MRKYLLLGAAFLPLAGCETFRDEAMEQDMAWTRQQPLTTPEPRASILDYIDPPTHLLWGGEAGRPETSVARGVEPPWIVGGPRSGEHGLRQSCGLVRLTVEREQGGRHGGRRRRAGRDVESVPQVAQRWAFWPVVPLARWSAVLPAR